jgi:formylglycine-generating enzyme required for sulfatase activity
MAELAAALLEASGSDASMEASALRRAALDRGPLSLVAELRERPLPPHANLLIVVDQFEELFRYQDLAGREEAEAFVALLLATAEQRQPPIPIVLTMRSDFFGECARFEGLAEAVSESIYLCPRLTRDQIIAAVQGPARVFGGRLEPALVARIVNDMGIDPDQLPLMQHALMRLWDDALTRDPAAPLLRLDAYLAAGGLKGSLSRHADEILAEVTCDAPQRSAIARHLFCLVTEGEGERAVRRLASVGEVAAVSEQTIAETTRVADAFRAAGRSLLMPPPARPLAADTMLDISHESLIRQWNTLRGWRRREAASVRQYREAERDLQRWMAGQTSLWQPRELRKLLAWRAQERPNAAWAARYGGDFPLIDQLLDHSRVLWQRARYGTLAAALGLCLLVALDIIRDHQLQPNTVAGSALVIILYALVFYGMNRNLPLALVTTATLLLLFILATAEKITNLIIGNDSWIKIDFFTWSTGALEIAALGFVLLQLRRLAHVGPQRRWASLKWLPRRWRRERRGPARPASPIAPAMPHAAAEPVEVESPELELRRQVRAQLGHWRAARRRDAAITGGIAALPAIVLVIWTAMAWSGVRHVESEMKFVAIPAGCFMMGSPASENGHRPNEEPVHKVCVTAFDLGQYDVTQGEWRRVMVFPNKPDPSRFTGNGRRPVEDVSWNDAKRFVWLMSLFGRRQYRLPSEAEWEFAARAGTTTSRYPGDDVDRLCAYENIADKSLKKVAPGDVVANCDDGYAYTAPVGSFKPNPWGLYDMLGNVSEWTEDCYLDNYRDTATDGRPNRQGPCTGRVIRGGNFDMIPSFVRAAHRFGSAPGSRSNYVGFRVVRTVRSR